ncbi:MAG: DEAD/DEAH box helicase, partial [Propionibacteriaceae bacterium]|nr:DEAD/DEAH box helicase [Propionibacteriaceae bacterium]
QPDQTLLAELGRAESHFHPLAQALRRAKPRSLRLTTAEIHHFLLRDADALERAGVEVLWPDWWGRRPRLGLKGVAQSETSAAPSLLDADSLYRFEWRLALGDQELTVDELAALAAAKAPLVRLRGDWVAFDPDRAQRALDFVQAQDQRQLTAVEVMRLAGRPGVDLPARVEADGPLGALLAGRAGEELAPVEPPPAFAGALRPYQKRGLAWLAFLSRLGLGACLADDMGLGKTIQLLALEACDRPPGHDGLDPTLIVCPMSLIGNWLREADRFTPWLTVVAHHGPERPQGAGALAVWRRADIVLTTYQLLVRDLDDFSARRWRRVVLDEAQYVKNAETKAAQAVRGLRTGRRVALTGTPVENRLAELRSLLDFLDPGLLGGPTQFRRRFARPIELDHDPEAARELRRITQPFILRRLKTDRSIITDLPEKIETRQSCLLTPEQASLYKAVVDDLMGQLEHSQGIERQGQVLAALTKLKQICDHPAVFWHDGSPVGRRSGKLTRLDEIVDELLQENGKALLFTQYTGFGDLLVRHLSARHGRDVAYLHGQVSRARRDAMVARFQSEDGPPLFVLSLRAGGTGLNLTAANHVLHVDRWWNPAVEDQATDRAFRIGQTRGVQVHKFICAGTLEERIDQLIESKKAVADLAIGAGEGWLTELSTDQLREVLALGEEAVDG